MHSVRLGRMRAMLLAIRQYCETFGQSPHSDVFNSQNEPIVSWRYRVAQFLDAPPTKFKLLKDTKWDDVEYAKWSGYRQNCICVKDSTSTSVVAVVGGDVAFTKGLCNSDVTALILIELSTSNIHWMAPKDFNINELEASSAVSLGRFLESPETDIVLGFGDGKVCLVRGDIQKDIIIRLARLSSEDRDQRESIIDSYRISSD